MSRNCLVLSFITLLTVLLVCGCTTSSPTTVQTAHAEAVIVDISSTPLGAEIYFDGEYRGTTPSVLRGASEGAHDIELRLQNYITVSKQIEITSGNDIYLDVTMERASSGSPTTPSATSSQTSKPTTVKTTTPTTVPTTVKTTTPTTVPTTAPTAPPANIFYSVSCTAQKDGNQVLVTYQGGADHSHLTGIECKINGVGVFSTQFPTVGETYFVQGTSGEDSVTVIGVFDGNQKQIILDTRLQSSSVVSPGYSGSSCGLETIGNIYGSTGGNGGQSIEKIQFIVGSIAGGAPIDMSKTLITFSTAERRVVLQKSNGGAPYTWKIANKYNAATDDELLEIGEQFELELIIIPGIRSNEQFNLEIQPQFGYSFPIIRTAPPEISSGGVYALW